MTNTNTSPTPAFAFLAQRVKDFFAHPEFAAYACARREKIASCADIVRVAALADDSVVRLSEEDYLYCVEVGIGKDPVQHDAEGLSKERAAFLASLSEFYEPLKRSAIAVCKNDMFHELKIQGMPHEYFMRVEELIENTVKLRREFMEKSTHESMTQPKKEAVPELDLVLNRHIAAAMSQIGVILPEFAKTKYVYHSTHQLCEQLKAFGYAEQWVDELCDAIKSGVENHDTLMQDSALLSERMFSQENQTQDQQITAILAQHYAPIVWNIVNTPSRQRLMLRVLRIRGIEYSLPLDSLTLKETYELVKKQVLSEHAQAGADRLTRELTGNEHMRQQFDALRKASLLAAHLLKC